VLGKVATNPFGLTVYLLSHYASHSNSMDTAGLYLLRRSGWWISFLFRLVGALFSAHIYLRFSWNISPTMICFFWKTPQNNRGI
jgi:hypothetical protein